MKKFVIESGRFFIDSSMILAVILSTCLIIAGFMASSQEPMAWIAGIILAVIVMGVAIYHTFILYLILDIRDALVKLTKMNEYKPEPDLQKSTNNFYEKYRR